MTHAQYLIQVFDTATYTRQLNTSIRSVSFRGISSPTELIFWASGSKGTIARSINGGKNISLMQIKGYDKSDFRDIHAWSANKAVVMSSGTPAVILITQDGGSTWKETFRKTDTTWFLDAIDFWDEQRGIAIADPINGRFILLQTLDGGQSWQLMDTTKIPMAAEGENLFAASGTALRCWGNNQFGFVTGGALSRLIIFNGNNYETVQLNIRQGENSQGANSFIRYDNDKYRIVGGDYKDTSATMLNSCSVVNNNTLISMLDGKNGVLSLKYYASCVDVLRTEKSQTVFIATGTNGTFIDDQNWRKIHNTPFHTMCSAPAGKCIYFAGPGGRLGVLKY
jgi:hypothetical protein